MSIQRSVTVGERELVIETGEVARRAHGAAVVRCGNTVVLATVVAAAEPTEGLDFLPLTVEYREKTASAARVPGSFMRREGKITDHEVIVSRIVDRSIRPLFPRGYAHEVQVHVTVLSADPKDLDPDALAVIASSAALHLSHVPWNGPCAAVGVAVTGERSVLLPSPDVRGGSDLDLVVGARPQGLVMVEGGAQEVPEAKIVEALDAACDGLAPVFQALDELRAEAGREKTVWAEPADDAGPEVNALRTQVLSGQRADGRGPTDLRDVTCRTTWLPTPHGSALFTRGQTQTSVTCTLASQASEQSIETLAGMERRGFMLHYNFPAYSVGEVRAFRGPGRREVGHGVLARRALLPVLPRPKAFPYVIRVESDVLESNGSSSMATVCGASLALMDAGVPVRAAVAGIAIGLVSEGDHTVILTDILGEEDHAGDMDLKVAGTRDGVTALQLDTKLGSLSRDVLEAALGQGRAGRLHILDAMDQELASSRTDKANGPGILTVEIPKEAVGLLIGPKGATIRGMQDKFGVEISVDDSGQVSILGMDGGSASLAAAKIRSMIGSVEVAKLYEGRIAKVIDAGAFVKLYESAEGWLHVSEWDAVHTEKMGDVVHEGDNVIVRVLGVDGRGRIRVSRKAALDRGDEAIVNVHA
ncbi:MAG: polyribonucleotide nucleotidyltransferase [Planctomycetes bacterium]|nr:polyribonucleotide nucleotidyltransferase [Planctomycetota bacterium]